MLGCLLLASWPGCGTLSAQLATGRLEGSVRTSAGSPVPMAGVLIEGAGLRLPLRADGAGRFALALPYGPYRISLAGESNAAAPVEIVPLETVRVTLVVTAGSPFASRAPLLPNLASGPRILEPVSIPRVFRSPHPCLRASPAP